MASTGDDATLIKVAVVALTISIFCTLGIQIMLVEASSDYDYDDIQAYRTDLISFSGDSMLNQTPWVLTHVYTPWNTTLDPASHYDDGWLFGEDVTSYPEIGKAADIHMDPDYKSNVPITFTKETASYQEKTGTKWWGGWSVTRWIGEQIGKDPYTWKTITANNWNFTGYRYVFDPTLPFSENPNQTSARDGSLSLVWYSYAAANGVQEGLSGGLDIYGGDIKLASYSAYDIIADYDQTSGYATTYDFDFSGTHLTLSVRFDPRVIENGTPLMQAWTQGSWSMAISSISAGNFLDLQNSNAYAFTLGGLIDTFKKILTFDLPEFDNQWAELMLWLMCGLPMTIAMLCVTMRVMNALKPMGG